MKVQDVMMSPVETAAGDDSVKLAALRMRASEVGVLPVVEQGQVIGILTDRDITVRGTAEGKDPDRTTVRELMTPRLIACAPDDELSDAARLMVAHSVRRLLVLDAHGQLVGILSVDDLAVLAADEGAPDVIAPPELASPTGGPR